MIVYHGSNMEVREPKLIRPILHSSALRMLKFEGSEVCG